MISPLIRRVALALITFLCIFTALAQGGSNKNSDDRDWTDRFDIQRCRFSTTGKNTYFILEPGYKLTLEGDDEGERVVLEITVLGDTLIVDGIATRVVEERESSDGELIEISRNYFAFCVENGSVFYFGEDVDMYDDGKVVNHSGAWKAGENGNRAGVMMPGIALLGASYYQEIATGVAMDRARIVSTDTTLVTPAGRFEHCLVVEETTPLETDALEYKIYAPGVGLIKDGPLLLKSISR